MLAKQNKSLQLEADTLDHKSSSVLAQAFLLSPTLVLHVFTVQTCSKGTCAGVMQECMLHLKSAQAAAQQGTALQPSSDTPLLVAYSSTSLRQTGTCVRARMKLLKVLSLHQATSAEAQAAVVSYLQGHMPGCRATQGKERNSGAQEVSSVHLQLVHMVRAESHSSSCCGLVHLGLTQLVGAEPNPSLCCRVLVSVRS